MENKDFLVVSRCYGWEAQKVSAPTMKDAIEIAKAHPEKWGDEGYEWYVNDKVVTAYEYDSDGNNGANFNNDLSTHSFDQALEVFTTEYKPHLMELMSLGNRIEKVSFAVPLYGEFDCDIDTDPFAFMAMLTNNGTKNTMNIPTISVLVKPKNFCEFHKEIALDHQISIDDFNNEWLQFDCFDCGELRILESILKRHNKRKYQWVCKSDDGCYEVTSKQTFANEDECYANMFAMVCDKIKNLSDEDFVTHFSKPKITYSSQSGTYIAEVVEC